MADYLQGRIQGYWCDKVMRWLHGGDWHCFAHASIAGACAKRVHAGLNAWRVRKSEFYRCALDCSGSCRPGESAEVNAVGVITTDVIATGVIAMKAIAMGVIVDAHVVHCGWLLHSQAWMAQKPLLMFRRRCSPAFSITALSPLAERRRQPLLPMLSPTAALVELPLS